VYNKCDEDEEEEGGLGPSKKDSLERSFKNTSLSSDEDTAERQVEEAHLNKDQQQQELREFERQIKQRYLRYEEPVEVIRDEAVMELAMVGCYPSSYLKACLKAKEKNYATAGYHLLVKKQQS